MLIYSIFRILRAMLLIWSFLSMTVEMRKTVEKFSPGKRYNYLFGPSYFNQGLSSLY